jgi:hypothetical protein
VHCPADETLCVDCLESLATLRPGAEQAGRELAELLASHVLPDQPWLDALDAKSVSIRARIRALSDDPRLITELAVICVHAARARWEELRRDRSPRD